MNLLRTLVPAILVSLTVLVVPATPAQAHAGLIGSSPADGATLDAAPTEITLEFSEEVRAPAFVIVTGPDTTTHEVDEPTINGAEVTQRVENVDQANGDWTLAYRVVSADGHPISGQVRFEVEGAAPPARTDAPTDEASESPAVTPADNTEPESGDDKNGGGPYILAASLAVLLVAVTTMSALKKRNDS